MINVADKSGSGRCRVCQDVIIPDQEMDDSNRIMFFCPICNSEFPLNYRNEYFSCEEDE